MKRFTAALLAVVGCGSLVTSPSRGHDAITTTVTWNREISRIFYQRCVACHRADGSAFSLAAYAEARPWAVAIKEEVLSRRMPPWGGVKGFGEFRNDQALTAEQIELITNWVEGGAPEGDPKDPLPELKLAEPAAVAEGDGVIIQGDFTLTRPFKLDGLMPHQAAIGASMQIVAEFPDGGIEPLLWLYEYKPEYKHPFLFRTPIDLPARTTIRGIVPGASMILVPAPSASETGAAR